ncbi:hypothetical protein [Nannocystis bainbridge]|uniref:PQQ-binding-like beta-propeller repeat protein n=1 Tax=Nannocystis bainbridge TaxID=2995303 RepID=A0ABT5DSV3_9BACT|nr:hypothetical protein [Nannocystis bainbridge]MDC0716255.1 hypothetical protein [Nannocystis bainbridge]
MPPAPLRTVHEARKRPRQRAVAEPHCDEHVELCWAGARAPVSGDGATASRGIVALEHHIRGLDLGAAVTFETTMQVAAPLGTRYASRPLQGLTMAKSRTFIIVLLAISGVLAVGASRFFASDDHKVFLTGAVTNTWDVVSFPAAPVTLPDTWASIPTRDADGSLFGLVQSNGAGALVKLDEATGRVLWRVALDPQPPSFARIDGWRVEEVFPAVPLTLAGDGVYLIAWSRDWVLVSSADGTLRKRGSFPEKVPPVSAVGGVCRIAEGFWIGVEDDRDGGIVLGAAGELASGRSDRPPDCLPAGARKNVEMMSPLQNAHASSETYPPEVCGKYNKINRRSEGNAWCSDMRSDGGPERTVMLKTFDPVFREDGGWRHVDFSGDVMNREVDFEPRILGFELAWPHAFFDMVEHRSQTMENRPSADSFEPKRVEQRDEVIEIVASITRDGALAWARSMYHGPMAATTDSIHDNMLQYRSLLLASHPDSPVRNLYILKPGMLLAVDQATGTPLFQVGTALPLPERPSPSPPPATPASTAVPQP